jgi:hypothetical protein
MNATPIKVAAVVVAILATSLAWAQTTTPGDAIDIEVVNPVDGSNTFCVTPSEILTARVHVRPGTGSLSCSLSCSPPSIPGGSANIATAAIDMAFDPARISYVPSSLQNNQTTAAVQGIPQLNLADNRVGWALAGGWSTPGDPSSTLLSPCDMPLLTNDSWVFSVQFQAESLGTTTLRLRRETDDPPFALSFADICGTEAFKQSNGGIDEVKNGTVLVSQDCTGVIFFDGFGSGDTNAWN